ncbi:DUF6542 domain-containing protein [Kitasatospora aureofaciens]|nr:DUF6542 domain-containing protein [Kitasatospora aureofaciens]ARF82386.1 hypothetical protein B6264_29065 [Kitasatospora aureofaciens]OEV36324.1 hypothetical protein HS99_0029595 [Kitasatospora aureofaciens]QEU98202.1 hypothetical protein CP971_01650 [Streptomyces viridifaciens]UKZ04089.1 hypothetical protein BOQ63_008460 [Streptomyces viridifaciens]
MAGQRARTSYQDAGTRTEDPAVPAQRSRGAGGATDPSRQGRAQRSGASRRRQQARRRGSLVAALAAVGLPLLGGTADELGGPGVGILFAVGAVLGTGIAALLCSRSGRWWVVTGAPLVVLLTASGVEYLSDPVRYQGKGLGAGAVRWVVEAFPVMAEAVAVALLVIVVRTVLEGRRPVRSTAPSGRGRRG